MIRAVVFLSLLAAVYTRQYGWNGPNPKSTVSPPNPCKDDPSCSCCLMLQRVNNMKTYFTNTLDVLEKETAKAEKCVKDYKDSRVAFSAGLYNSFKCTTMANSDQTVLYQTVFINIGGAYDMTKGVFTAPTTGIYSITVTIYSDAGSVNSPLHACAQLHVNGQTIAGASEQNNHDQEDSVSIAVARQLNAGDKVSVNLPAGCLLCDDSHYNTFSAFLLFANP